MVFAEGYGDDAVAGWGGGGEDLGVKAKGEAAEREGKPMRSAQGLDTTEGEVGEETVGDLGHHFEGGGNGEQGEAANLRITQRDVGGPDGVVVEVGEISKVQDAPERKRGVGAVELLGAEKERRFEPADGDGGGEGVQVGGRDVFGRRGWCNAEDTLRVNQLGANGGEGAGEVDGQGAGVFLDVGGGEVQTARMGKETEAGVIDVDAVGGEKPKRLADLHATCAVKDVHGDDGDGVAPGQDFADKGREETTCADLDKDAAPIVIHPADHGAEVDGLEHLLHESGDNGGGGEAHRIAVDARVEGNLGLTVDVFGEEITQASAHLRIAVAGVEGSCEGLRGGDTTAVVDGDFDLGLFLWGDGHDAVVIGEDLGENDARRVTQGKLAQAGDVNAGDGELHPFGAGPPFGTQTEKHTPSIAKDLDETELRVVVGGVKGGEGAKTNTTNSVRTHADGLEEVCENLAGEIGGGGSEKGKETFRGGKGKRVLRGSGEEPFGGRGNVAKSGEGLLHVVKTLADTIEGEGEVAHHFEVEAAGAGENVGELTAVQCEGMGGEEDAGFVARAGPPTTERLTGEAEFAHHFLNSGDPKTGDTVFPACVAGGGVNHINQTKAAATHNEGKQAVNGLREFLRSFSTHQAKHAFRALDRHVGLLIPQLPRWSPHRPVLSGRGLRRPSGVCGWRLQSTAVPPAPNSRPGRDLRSVRRYRLPA